MNQETTKIIKKDQKLSKFEEMLLSGGFLPEDFTKENLELGMQYMRNYLQKNQNLKRETRIILGFHYLEIGTYLHYREEK